MTPPLCKQKKTPTTITLEAPGLSQQNQPPFYNYISLENITEVINGELNFLKFFLLLMFSIVKKCRLFYNLMLSNSNLFLLNFITRFSTVFEVSCQRQGKLLFTVMSNPLRTQMLLKHMSHLGHGMALPPPSKASDHLCKPRGAG